MLLCSCAGNRHTHMDLNVSIFISNISLNFSFNLFLQSSVVKMEEREDSYSDTQSPIPALVPESTQENRVDSTVQTDQPGEQVWKICTENVQINIAFESKSPSVLNTFVCHFCRLLLSNWGSWMVFNSWDWPWLLHQQISGFTWSQLR